ncbi:MAG: thioredoxin family protein [Bacteroidota bacterium]
MRWIFVLALVLSANAYTQAQGIDFFHGSWEEALEEAQKQEKVIFVDAYTTWCGPCKRMAKTVFTNDKVGEYYNSNFICMKIDMESQAGGRFMAKYPVAAYPTLYYIDGSGKVLMNIKGAQNVDNFLHLGQSVLSQMDNSQQYAEAYEAGDRSPELLLKYVKALNKAGKPSLKIANEYLKSQKDLTTEDNLRFIYEATTQADSRVFDLMIKHREAITKLVGKKEVSEKIQSACLRASQKAIKYQSADLHEEAKEKMRKHLPKAEAAALAMEADLDYYKSVADSKNYLKACSAYVKKEAKNNAILLHQLAQDIEAGFSDDDKAMKQAEKYAKKAAENGGRYDYYFTYAYILYKNGKKSDALNMARKSLKLAEETKGDKRNINILIKKIEES